ncbi:MAG: DNA polymerase IV [Eubacteriales bacterium]|nr:DNA polymerase IV [Eubacteriales bacterium]
MKDGKRVILHCDLNNFYASVECLYRPELRDKPVAVCGSQSTRHGIVLAKNMAAKAMGITTGEPVWKAASKCPGLIAVPPRYGLYLRFSSSVRDILLRYTNLVEAFGIDESWMDVTESTVLFGSGEEIAEKIRQSVKDELGITVSVGVSFNKIFAKLGSDMRKPDIVTCITEDNFREMIWGMPAGDLLYVGRSTAVKLSRAGIYTIGDLALAPPSFLTGKLGKWGETLWAFANGYDAAPVCDSDFEHSIKGIGNSLTTPSDLTCNTDVKALLHVLAESVARRLRRHYLKGRTIQVWVRGADLSSSQKQGKLPFYTYISGEIAEKAFELFKSFWRWDIGIRAAGVRVTDLADAEKHIQLSFFPPGPRQRKELVEHCVDGIRSRFGHYSVQKAFLLLEKAGETTGFNPFAPFRK